jgi:cytosine/adenosine deaminase-related metal-dependent hydrolase
MCTPSSISAGIDPHDLSTFAWAVTYARPFYAALTEEEAYIAARLACLEMLSNGTTCFVDANVLVSHRHLDAVAHAVTESGMRAVLGRGYSTLMPQAMADVMSPALRERVLYPSADAALRDVDALLGRWTRSADGRIRVWATVYGLFPIARTSLFGGLRALADRYDTGMAFHIASSIEEAQGVEARVGAWPITHLDRLGVLGPKLLLTHCTAVTDREVGILAERGTKVAYCPGLPSAWPRGRHGLARSRRCWRRVSRCPSAPTACPQAARSITPA